MSTGAVPPDAEARVYLVILAVVVVLLVAYLIGQAIADRRHADRQIERLNGSVERAYREASEWAAYARGLEGRPPARRAAPAPGGKPAPLAPMLQGPRHAVSDASDAVTEPMPAVDDRRQS